MLAEWLRPKRAGILARWIEGILETYPADTAKLFARCKAPFQNPVGQTIAREIERLYDYIVQGAAPQSATDALENILRIRAVQDLSPSAAVGFLLYVRRLLREALADAIQRPDGAAAWTQIESRIDELALRAFDVYMECRERIFRIRASEIKRAFTLGRPVCPGAAKPPDNGSPGACANEPSGLTRGNDR